LLLNNPAQSLLHRETAAKKTYAHQVTGLKTAKWYFGELLLDRSSAIVISFWCGGETKFTPALGSKSRAGPERFNEGEVRCRVVAQSTETVSPTNRECEQIL